MTSRQNADERIIDNLFQHLLDSVEKIVKSMKPFLSEDIPPNIIDTKLRFDLFFPLFASIGVISNSPLVKLNNSKAIFDKVLNKYEHHLNDLYSTKPYDLNLFIKEPTEINIFLSAVPSDTTKNNLLPSTNLWTMFDIIADKRYNEYAQIIMKDYQRMNNPGFMSLLPPVVIKNTIGTDKYKYHADLFLSFWSFMVEYDGSIIKILNETDDLSTATVSPQVPMETKINRLVIMFLGFLLFLLIAFLLRS